MAKISKLTSAMSNTYESMESDLVENESLDSLNIKTKVSPKETKRKIEKANKEIEQELGTKIQEIDIDQLVENNNHTFKVIDNFDMQLLKESIKLVGVFEPLIVRPIVIDGQDKYELIAGHRRRFAASAVGLKKLPCIITDISDDESNVYMVDSNAHRSKILPSEKAKSYKLKYDSLKRMGKQTIIDDNGNEVILTPMDMLEENDEFSLTQILKYIKIADLPDTLLDLLDADVFGIQAAYTFAFLSFNNANILGEVLSEVVENNPEFTVTIKIAENIRKAAKPGEPLSEEKLLNLLYGTKKARKTTSKKIKIDEKTINELLPEEFSKAKSAVKLEFTKDAYEFYFDYLTNNPELKDKYQ